MTSTAKVTVKDKQTAVNVHDSTLYVGDTWKAEDNFDSALDKDGNPVDYTQLTVDDSKVDTNTAGIYDVTYTYDGVTSTAKVTVKDKQTAVLHTEENEDKGTDTEKNIENNNNINVKSDDSGSEYKLPETGEKQLLVTTTTIFGLVTLLISILLLRKPFKK